MDQPIWWDRRLGGQSPPLAPWKGETNSLMPPLLKRVCAHALTFDSESRFPIPPSPARGEGFGTPFPDGKGRERVTTT